LEVENGFVQSLSRRRKLLILDIDPTDDPTHGAQQLTFFHGYYDTHMYFPLLVFDGETGDLASVVLRPGNVGGTRGARGLIDRLVRTIRQRCPRATILVRADGAFATPEFLDKLDELHEQLGNVGYVVGVAKNKVLVERLQPWLLLAEKLCERTGQAARQFQSFQHKAGTWPHRRRVVGKAEHLPDGANPRFVVTNLIDNDEQVYETYCGRGQAENYIKAFKNGARRPAVVLDVRGQLPTRAGVRTRVPATARPAGSRAADESADHAVRHAAHPPSQGGRHHHAVGATHPGATAGELPRSRDVPRRGAMALVARTGVETPSSPVSSERSAPPAGAKVSCADHHRAYDWRVAPSKRSEPA
jgi:hypothetical protein